MTYVVDPFAAYDDWREQALADDLAMRQSRNRSFDIQTHEERKRAQFEKANALFDPPPDPVSRIPVSDTLKRLLGHVEGAMKTEGDEPPEPGAVEQEVVHG